MNSIVFDENTFVCYRIVEHINLAVSPGLKVAKALEIDYNR